MLYSTKLRRWAAIGWTVIMMIGLSWPQENLPDLEEGQDKWLHELIFGLFGLLWVWSGQKPLTVFGAGLGYAIFTEIWQAIMPINRQGDVYDVLADMIGVLLGIGIGVLASKFIPARE